MNIASSRHDARAIYESPSMHIVKLDGADIVRTSAGSSPGAGWHWCSNSGTWVESGWSCPV
ncbi:hypothetical protein Uis1B_0738 [Bifidobacterium margollesii]|uniref:Uncharacterized protein n=1 Tax=Bifidobacterium margollesii TaxID=2020964 RepID=A0A2N5JB08_9BIFI|nr:hypothetical protein [Bifidobacterium margollesii]PLS31397.1 hypothetical protein Uis1B_0738 [Bifidobacterium margollesii]